MINSPEHNLTLAPLLGMVDATQRIGQWVHPHHGGSGYLLSANNQVRLKLVLKFPFWWGLVAKSRMCGALSNWFPSQCSCCKDFLCRFGTLYNSNWLCGLQNLIGIQTFLFLRALGGGGEKRAPVWSLPVCGTSSLSSFLSTCWAWSKRKLEETYVVHCWYLYRNVTKILMKKSKRIHYSFW